MTGRFERFAPILFCFVLSVTLFLYKQTLGFDFISLDDLNFVYLNNHIHQGINSESLKWIFSADLLFDSKNVDYWQPVTFFSRLIDIELFDLNPAGHHLTNIALHAANVLLLFMLLGRMTRQWICSLWVSAFFALHPAQVEAIAWISARKDVLSVFFGLLCAHQYFFYTLKPSLKRQFVLLLVYFLALMAKPMMVTLPVIFLLLDYWPLGRTGFRKLVKEKSALFFGSFCSALIVILYLGHEVFYTSTTTMFFHSLEICLSQMIKVFLPIALRLYHNDPILQIHSMYAFASLMLIFLVTFAGWRFRKKHPYILVGWLWFLFGLLPTISRRWPDDRFLYFPIIGLCIAVVWFLKNKIQNLNLMRGIVGLGLVALSLCAGLSFNQISYWKNDETLYSRALQFDSSNVRLKYMLARAFAWKGEITKATEIIADVYQTFSPDQARAHAYLLYGDALLEQNRKELARWNYERALELKPDDFVIQQRLIGLAG